MTLEFNGNIPIYLQIMDMIKRDIVTGKLKGGDKLTSVREMAESLKVNPNTVQRVYQELERENIAYTQRGMGTFITQDSMKILSLKREMSHKILSDFVDGMMKLGFTGEEIIEAVREYLRRNTNADSV